MDSNVLVRDTLVKSHVSVGSPAALLIGLSGGADSVALLVSLCSIAEERRLKLHAIHVNHHLRENADADEAFCRDLCERLHVPLTVASVCVPRAGSIEANAREMRYKAFREALEKTKSDLLVLAHHMDDQAETVLMHLIYGAGSTGLGGMKALSGDIWRPFLGLRREVLRDYLCKNGFEWREDESNADVRFTRNKIRSVLMPVIEKCAPEAVSAVARTADILQEEDRLLDDYAQAWLNEHASRGAMRFLRAEELKCEHTALQRRILRKYAALAGVTLDFDQTERVRKLLHASGGSTDNLPGGGIAYRGEKYLHFLPGGWKDKKQQTLAPLSVCKGDSVIGGYAQPIPKSQTEGLQLRTRAPGDYIQPFGMKGSKSLKEYMIEHGIERPFRASWPLVCRGSEVLWVIGIGASEKLRVNNAQNPEYKLIYAGTLPDQL